MQKTAQKRRWRDIVREKTTGNLFSPEHWFDPEFKDIMDNLRDKTDDPIRSIISGKEIGLYPIGGDGVSCKDLIKEARSKVAQREYMLAVGDIGRFHKKFVHVTNLIKAFDHNVDKVHRRFLFDELDPSKPGYNKEYAGYLQDIKERFGDKKEASFQAPLIKEAGIIDFFKNIGSSRGRALMAWEMRYPGRTKGLKKDLIRLLDQSDKLLKATLHSLTSMGTHRATRKVDDYVKEAHKIVSNFKIYDDLFKKFYSDHLKTLMEAQEFIEKIVPSEKNEKELSKEKEESKAKIREEIDEVEKTNKPGEPAYTSSTIDVLPTSPELNRVNPNAVVPYGGSQEMSLFQEPSAPGFIGAPRGLVRPSNKPSPVSPSAPPVPSATPQLSQPLTQNVLTPQQAKAIKDQQRAQQKAEEDADIAKANQAEALRRAQIAKQVKPAHSKFVESLESLSGEHPIILAKVIMKYANSIENSDPLFYEHLINVVNSIKV